LWALLAGKETPLLVGAGAGSVAPGWVLNPRHSLTDALQQGKAAAAAAARLGPSTAQKQQEGVQAANANWNSAEVRSQACTVCVYLPYVTNTQLVCICGTADGACV
jgi:Flp pilus assembly protein TadG